MTFSSLADLVGAIESGHNPRAIRFERETYNRVLYGHFGVMELIAQRNQCSVETARMIYSTSWGEYQFMGYDLYDSGYDISVYGGSVIEFCESQIEQITFFEEWTQKRNVAYSLDELKDSANAFNFGKVWNGNGAEYGATIQQFLSK